MVIYPAIDIQKGRCVRLYQGKFDRETVYHSDPFLMAKQMVSDGATWLHLVDLDGAKDPKQQQKDFISELMKANNVNIQVGGGIRSQDQVKKLIENGAARIIIGSMAVTDKETVSRWFSYFGAEKIVLALDILMDKNNVPRVACHGWKNATDFSLYDLIRFYQPVGLTHLLCTNILLDGTLNGPDYSLYETLTNQFPLLKIQASGGIQSLADIQMLREKRLAGAIIGRALYEKKFTLNEALTC